MMLVLVLLAATQAPPAVADSRTFYLDHASAEGLPELLDRLAAGKAELVQPLQPHWAILKARVTVDPGRNALRAEGSREELDALAQVLKVMDMPRPQITLLYRRIRVAYAGDLLGEPAAPPIADAFVAAAGPIPQVGLVPGDWSARVDDLVAAAKVEVLSEGEVSVIDGRWGSVYLGDPEATKPVFCLQARAVVARDGAVWLSLAHGALRRRGGEAEPTEIRTGAQGAVCVNCGPGVGEMLLVPQLVVTTRVGAGQSALASGIRWCLSGEEADGAVDHEFTLVTPRVEAD